jgi:hypothetical protein
MRIEFRSIELKYLFTIVLVGFTWESFGVDLSVDEPLTRLGGIVEILDKADPALTFQDILTPSVSSEFRKNTEDDINLGVVDGVYWFRFNLTNADPDPTRKILVIANPAIHDVQFFCPRPEGDYKLVDLDGKGFDARPVKYRHCIFPLDMEPGFGGDYYLRVRASGSLRFPLEVWNPPAYSAIQFKEMTFIGGFIGGLILMALYQLVMMVSLKDYMYLYYVLFLATAIIFELHSKGFALWFFWSNFPQAEAPATFFSFGLMIGFSVLFARRFMRSSKHVPKLDKGLLGLAGVSFLLCLLGLSDRLEAYYVAYFLGVTWPTYVFAVVAYAWLAAGVRRARFLAIAWGGLFLGSLLLALVGIAVIPSNFFTEHSNEIGFLASVVFLALALADRTNLQTEFTRERLREAVDERTIELRTALDNVKTLEGLLPVCSYCKKIRNDDGDWNQMEKYLQSHSKVKFTHSYCPECLEKVHEEHGLGEV